MKSEDVLKVALVDCPEPSTLGAMWQALEQQSSHSFFTSWTWIGCWLARHEPRRRPRLLCAMRDQRVVGLALIGAKIGVRLKLLPSRCWYLHATGDRRHDDIHIEHNGLLVSREGAAEIEAAMLDHLCAAQAGWDQLHLPAMTHVPPLAGLAKYDSLVREKSDAAYSVNLAAVREAGGDYLSQLGVNARSQIRRSLRAYGELGAVTLTQARDTQQALQFLERLKVLHQRTWTSRDAPGAFANPRFEEFHAQLISKGFARGEVQLLRAHAGEHDIGYLYNFVHRSRVLAYQSGFNYELLQRNNHPGLSTHALAIRHCVDAGLDVYDFLAGDARYKRQLASDTFQMFSLSIHRKTPSFRLETHWRALKQRVLPANVAANLQDKLSVDRA